VLCVKAHFYDAKSMPVKELVSLDECSEVNFQILKVKCFINCLFWSNIFVMAKFFISEKQISMNLPFYFAICNFFSVSQTKLCHWKFRLFCFWIVMEDPRSIKSQYICERSGIFNNLAEKLEENLLSPTFLKILNTAAAKHCNCKNET
jgi:hypothetical protein